MCVVSSCHICDNWLQQPQETNIPSKHLWIELEGREGFLPVCRHTIAKNSRVWGEERAAPQPCAASKGLPAASARERIV